MKQKVNSEVLAKDDGVQVAVVGTAMSHSER